MEVREDGRGRGGMKGGLSNGVSKGEEVWDDTEGLCG